jgi:hypothetical protein
MNVYRNIAVKDLETAKKVAVWGTHGKSGTEPLKYVRLIDCETSHLQAILKTQITHMHPEYIEIVTAILNDRGAPLNPEE